MPDIDPATSPECHAVHTIVVPQQSTLKASIPFRGLSFFCRPNGMEVIPVTATSSPFTSNGLGELPREPVMLRHPSMASDECRHRAEEALTLAAQTQDDWERELFQRIATQWVVLAVHKEGKEGNTSHQA
jgi:hypothetical protein